MLDFYLSEMSVSDHHGGGLTLQRVLRESADDIQSFVHVHRFATDRPVAGRFQQRCLDLPNPFEGDPLRRMIGCTVSNRLSQWQMVRQWQAKRVARAVAARFSDVKRPLRALACPQGPASLYAMEALAQIREVEYITWVMDDHLVRWKSGGWRYPEGMEALFARHLRKARQVFVISPVMAEFYRQRFGIESQVLFGPADVCETPGEVAGAGEGGIRLGYFGALDQWQNDALARLAGCLATTEAVLDIYTGRKSLPSGLQLKGVVLKDRIPAARVAETMRGYDAVILPISFLPELRHMSEFNIATKMSECLASGTVTLVVGPAYSAMVRFLEAHGAACLFTGGNHDDLRTRIENLKCEKHRGMILNRARELVRSELSTAIMHGRWLSAADAFAA